MLTAFLAALITVGGFPFEKVVLSERTKTATSAPPEYEPKWTERVETIAGKDASDEDFSKFMLEKSIQLRRDSYRGDAFPDPREKLESFETFNDAGSMNVYADVIAASDDLVAVTFESRSYYAGASHPDIGQSERINWSRRLHRILTQEDVFAIAPDITLRMLALSFLKDRESLSPDQRWDDVPLLWSRASIGPLGISWNFGPYELGGYASGGTTTVPWAALKPYLQHKLPFEITAIRAAPNLPQRPN